MTTSINSFMAEVQAAMAAQAKVPELEAALVTTTNQRDQSQRHAQELELKVKDLRAVIDSHLSTIAKLREERDDASFRVLEAEDKLATFAKAVGNAWGGIGNALNAVNPPKAEPEPVKAEVKTSDPNPITSGTASPGVLSQNDAQKPDTASPPVTSSTEGQSASPPSSNVSSSAVEQPQPAGGEFAKAPIDATGSQSSSSKTDFWKPSVEMPEVKAEDKPHPDGVYRDFQF